MKRAIAHILTAGIALGILYVRLRAAGTIVLLLWYAPNMIAVVSVIALSLLNLRNKPVCADETLPIFFAAVLSTNFCVFISLFGGYYPMYRIAPLAGLQIAGNLLNLLSMPFYLWALFSLGQSFAILPESHTLRMTGVYQISRHPLYLTYMLWCLTQNLIYQTWTVLAFSFIQIALYRFRAKREEQILSDTFPEYSAYQKKVLWLGARRAAGSRSRELRRAGA